MGDDLFLGGSLMKDLLADLATVDEEDTDWLNLESLEKELNQIQDSEFTNEPLSAASMVVNATPTTSTSETLDAWSLSLQNFTTLQEEFLRADSEKKQQAPPGLAGANNLQEYNVNEAPRSPPGLKKTKPVETKHEQAPPATAPPVQQPPIPVAAAPPMPPVPLIAAPVPPALPSAPPVHHPPAPTVPPPAQMAQQLEQKLQQVQGGMPPPNFRNIPMAMPMTPQNSMGIVTPHPTPVPVVPVRVFANPHPTAVPINATALSTPNMSARDICYVVHSILKPVLGSTEATYHLQYWMKHHPVKPPSSQKTPHKDFNAELEKRHEKARLWSADKKVLGSTVKSNVNRPRALIAVSMPEANTESSARANLWKSRIYVDQGYAIFTTFQNQPSQIVKLCKIFGMDNQTVDQSVMALVLKLSKGKVLLARILENHMFPMVVVNVLVPATLQTLFGMESTDDDRLYGVLATLQLKYKAILECLEILKAHPKQALATTARMAFLHSLLRNGALRAEDGWEVIEEDFMNFLSGV